jgi:hypothetical protein
VAKFPILSSAIRQKLIERERAAATAAVFLL